MPAEVFSFEIRVNVIKLIQKSTGASIILAQVTNDRQQGQP